MTKVIALATLAFFDVVSIYYVYILSMILYLKNNMK